MGTEPTTDESASAPGVGARRARPGRSGRAGEARLFVLDTSVLMHDPTALFRFGAHDVYLPMAVLEEMDAAKKGVSEIARNVREVSRILDGIIRAADQAPIEQGFPLPGATGEAAAGRLYFQTRDCSDPLPDVVPGSHSDNGILNVARMLHRERPGRAVVIVRDHGERCHRGNCRRALEKVSPVHVVTSGTTPSPHLTSSSGRKPP